MQKQKLLKMAEEWEKEDTERATEGQRKRRYFEHSDRE